METDGGGWTVFLRRQDGSVDFSNNWAAYEYGFGNLSGEFWLGLSKIHRLTPNGQNSLRVDLGDFESNTVYAQYSEFEILDDTTQYAIVIKDYNGTAGDDLTNVYNIMKFTTHDKDNDNANTQNCANYYKGGWWFNRCHYSYLTGPYKLRESGNSNAVGIIWVSWKGDDYSLKFAEMKVRRN